MGCLLCSMRFPFSFSEVFFWCLYFFSFDLLSLPCFSLRLSPFPQWPSFPVHSHLHVTPDETTLTQTTQIPLDHSQESACRLGHRRGSALLLVPRVGHQFAGKGRQGAGGVCGLFPRLEAGEGGRAYGA